MNITDTYQAYADAFEEFYIDGDAGRLIPYFTEGAVYLPGDGTEHSGRDQIFAYFAKATNGLDKKFDKRELSITGGPDVTDSQVSIAWTATYTKSGLPALVIDGREIASFTGDAMNRLEDILDEASALGMQDWLTSHGSQLG